MRIIGAGLALIWIMSVIGMLIALSVGTTEGFRHVVVLAFIGSGCVLFVGSFFSSLIKEDEEKQGRETEKVVREIMAGTQERIGQQLVDWDRAFAERHPRFEPRFEAEHRFYARYGYK